MALTPDQMTQLVKELMEYVKKRGYKTIQFEGEDAYYQKVWHQDRDIYNPNPPVTIGYLDEDLQALERTLSGELVPTAYDLQRIGAVLTALGAVISGSSAKKNE